MTAIAEPRRPKLLQQAAGIRQDLGRWAAAKRPTRRRQAAVKVAIRRDHHPWSVLQRKPLWLAIDRLLDLALPASCAGCGLEGQPLCRTCLPALDARLDRPSGTLIGLPSETPAPLLQLEWCAPFEGAVRRALHQLKYAGERRLAKPLGRAIAHRWARAGAGGDLLVPVPVHPDRARTRGYDQAALIAVEAGREAGLPVAQILQRTRATVAQYNLDRPRRAENVAGAFSLVRLPAPPTAEPHEPRSGGPLNGRWVVLVDDVVTTGATLAACARVLLAAGAVGVSAATVARER